MFEIVDNQVIKVEERGSAEKGNYRLIKVAVGSVNKVKVNKLEDRIVYQWHKFNLKLSDYEIDVNNTTPILIDWKEYIPEQGKVETMKNIG